MRENFKRFTVASGAAKASRVPKTVGSFHFSPPAISIFTFVALLTNWIYVQIFSNKTLFASKEEESAEKGWCYIYKMGLAKSGDTCVRLKSVSAVAVFPPLSFSKNFQSHFPGFPPLCNDILKQFARLIRRHVKFFNCQQIGNIFRRRRIQKNLGIPETRLKNTWYYKLYYYILK